MLAKATRDSFNHSDKDGDFSKLSRSHLSTELRRLSGTGDVAPTNGDGDQGSSTATSNTKLEISDVTLCNIAFLARYIAFRIRGNKNLNQASLLERSKNPTALIGVLSRVARCCIENEVTRREIGVYLTGIMEERADQFRSRSAFQNLSLRPTTEALPESIAEFSYAPIFNALFPIPASLRHGLRELATSAADLIAADPAFSARMTPASGSPSTEDLARHLLQIILSSNMVWQGLCMTNPLRKYSEEKLGFTLGEPGATDSIRGATVTAADSLSQYWSCHLTQRLLSKIGRPELADAFSKLVAETTVSQHYFDKQDWRQSYHLIMQTLVEYAEILNHLQFGLCHVLNWQPLCRDIISTLAEELAPPAPSATTVQPVDNSLLEKSPLAVLRIGSHPTNPALYSLRWISDKTYALMITRQIENEASGLAHVHFLISTAGETLRIFSLGRIHTCELDPEDTTVICGENPPDLPVTAAITSLFNQLQQGLQQIAIFEPAVFKRCADFPEGVSVEPHEDGFTLRYAPERSSEMADLFSHLPDTAEYMRGLNESDATEHTVYIHYQPVSYGPSNATAKEGPSQEPATQESRSPTQLRSEVTSLLNEHDFKFCQFFGFLRDNWGVENVQGGKHKHLFRKPYRFPTSQYMRDPDEPLKTFMAFAIFEALHIPLEDVADKLRTML